MDGDLEWEGHRTWYRVVGELDADAMRAPVVICHGGPGATHEYVAPIAALARAGRACVLYDQLGNGRSEHLPDADPSFWTVDLFARELAALAERLGIDARYHVLGHSWGGVLAFEHALRRPPGLVSIVAADTPPSMDDFVEGCNELRGTLPRDVQDTLDRHESAGSTHSEEYARALEEYSTRFVCRRDPWPDELVASFDAMDDEPVVYVAMHGPTEFRVQGTLRNWDIAGRLSDIDVPVLLVSGGHDEVRPWIVEKIRRGLPRAEWVLFEDSSHTPHVEEPERFLEVVETFLERVERE